MLCAACSTGKHIHDYPAYLENKGANYVDREEFAHCRGYGCKYVDRVGLPEKDWQKLARFFAGNATAEEERESITQAVAWLEKRVGAITGTEEDIGGTFREFGALQHDCVDESTNTTVYLGLMEKEGLLKHHRVRKPHMRAPILGGGWPHQSAAITEIASGEEYAIDSWFTDNGGAVYAVPLRQWVWAWSPEDVEKASYPPLPERKPML